MTEQRKTSIDPITMQEGSPPQNDWQELARQLRSPSGDEGRKVAVSMNHANMEMIVRAFELSELAPDQQLLELGPGNGAHLQEVMHRWPGICYTGVEISETMIHEACTRNQGLRNIALLMTDGQKLPFGDQAFDRILTVNTLYFWEEPAAYAAEIRRVLKTESGLFCLAFVDDESMEKLPFTAHGFKLYNLETARQLLADAGFVIRGKFSETGTILSNTGDKIDRTINYILAGRD